MKFDKSRELYERSRKSLAGGVSSQGRMDEKPFPLFFERLKALIFMTLTAISMLTTDGRRPHHLRPCS